MKSRLEELVGRYRELGIDRQLDYDKFYLYSIITHSTAIEGSTITELENQIMFDNGIALKGKSLVEQNMNLDLKAAYERALVYSRELNRDISSYLESIGEDAPVVHPKKKIKTRDRIIELLSKNPKHTTRTLAEEIGITPKGVERHLAILKSEGFLHRIGPDKGGKLQVIEVSQPMTEQISAMLQITETKKAFSFFNTLIRQSNEHCNMNIT